MRTLSQTPSAPNLFSKTYFERLAAFIKQNPHLAARTYANAAKQIRLRDRTLQGKLIANKLDQLAAQATVPATDADGETYPKPFPETTPNLRTENKQLEKAVILSKEGPEGPNDELTAAWHETEITKIGDDVLVPHTAVSGRTLFGDQALVQYGGISGNSSFVTGGLTGITPAQTESPIIRWDGIEEEVQAVTVAISPGTYISPATYPAAQNGSGTNYNYRPYARCFFGTALGRPNEVAVDVGRGIQFTIITCFLNVNVGMDPNPANTTPGSMQITGNVGFNPAGTNAVITRTRYVDNLASSGTQNVVVPFFATSLLPIMRSDVSGTSAVTLNFKDAAGVVRYTFALSGSTQQQQPLPMTGDVYSVDVVNGGNTTASFFLCFALAL